MEAIKPRDIRIEEVWDYTKSIFQELSVFYNKPFHRHLTFLDSIPRVVMFDSNNLKAPIEVYPRHIISQKTNRMRLKIVSQMARLEVIAAYHSDLIGFVYDRKGLQEKDGLAKNMIEEVTHHVIRSGPNGLITIDPEKLRNLNRTVGAGNYGDRLADAVKSLDLIRGVSYIDFDLTPQLDLGEFFIPISLAFAFKRGYIDSIKNEFEPQDWNWLDIYFPAGTEEENEWQEKNYKRAHKIISIVAHLPYIAGHKLIMEYSGDAKALLQDYPHLAYLSARTLWEQFGSPLLLG